ncbi:MAG TPA: putative lipid II flippase FtsW [Candidatus Babeliales bacterium]|nr:putative lipid II flippase FtsW [Candidatus Babeliales bacterium]
MKHYQQRQQLQFELRCFLGVIAVLTILGVLFVYSASSVYALESFGAANFFLKKQLISIVLGLILLLGAAQLSLDTLKRWTPLAFLGAFSLTSLTLVPQLATRIHGSSRWLALGSLGVQPSEFLKWALLLYVASLLARHWYQKGSLIRTIMPISVITGLSALVLLRQPDFGLTVTLCTTIIIFLFIAQFNLKYLVGGICLALPALAYLIFTKAYRLQRILTFLNPWRDPRGAGFQVIQSLIAIGSGGVWGVGIANSKQKFFYLPMQHTDFIFAIIAEETGFVGAVLLVALYILLAYLGIKMALQLQDHYASFAVLGFTVFNTLQALINLGVATGLLPTKGIGLPFVSYGGSALMANGLMLGVLISCVRDQR